MTDDWDDTVAAFSIEPDLGPSRAYLVVIRGNNVGETHQVVGPDMVIGRAAGVDLRLNDEGVSRFHCKLRHVANGIIVEDLASRNGTYCNGDRVVPNMRVLLEGDRLQIGTTTILRFTYVDVNSTPDATSPVEADAMRDTLTGTFSRRAFIDRLEGEIELVKSRKAPLSLLMVHIDRYSEIHATHGQAVADQLNAALAVHILENIRKEDVVARIADGEFAVMCRSPSPGDTFMLAERLRATGGRLSATVAEGPAATTLSIGVASVVELRIDTAHDLLVAAGSVLQRARSQGGNRVVLCTEELLHEPKGRARV